MAMLSSAGVVEGQKRFDSPSYFFRHQLLYGVLPGLILFFLAARIDYRFWRKIALPLLILVVGLMVLVFIPRFGLTIRGAQRWLDLGFITFQPAEFLKLGLVIYLAAWFGQRAGRFGGNWTYTLVPFLLVIGFVGLLLVLQPDTKTLVLVTIIGLTMYFFSGAKLKHLAALTAVALTAIGVLSLTSYRFDRIEAFFNPKADTQSVAYHINQALLGVGSGGIFGVGFGQSKQKINFLPEPVGDSIFAVIVEELGFVGGMAVLLLFGALVLTLTHIAKNTSDQFGKLYVLGVAVWVVSQTFINIGSILKLIPLTGAPLPFFSYGSSSLVALLAALGIVANIAKHG